MIRQHNRTTNNQSSDNIHSIMQTNTEEMKVSVVRNVMPSESRDAPLHIALEISSNEGQYMSKEKDNVPWSFSQTTDHINSQQTKPLRDIIRLGEEEHFRLSSIRHSALKDIEDTGLTSMQSSSSTQSITALSTEQECIYTIPLDDEPIDTSTIEQTACNAPAPDALASDTLAPDTLAPDSFASNAPAFDTHASDATSTAAINASLNTPNTSPTAPASDTRAPNELLYAHPIEETLSIPNITSSTTRTSPMIDQFAGFCWSERNRLFSRIRGILIRLIIWLDGIDIRCLYCQLIQQQQLQQQQHR